jgi:hypothetical protein
MDQAAQIGHLETEKLRTDKSGPGVQAQDQSQVLNTSHLMTVLSTIGTALPFEHDECGSFCQFEYGTWIGHLALALMPCLTSCGDEGEGNVARPTEASNCVQGQLGGEVAMLHIFSLQKCNTTYNIISIFTFLQHTNAITS